MATTDPAVSTKLSELVHYLQCFGFPKPVSTEDLGEALTERQMKVIAEALDLVDDHALLKEKYQRTQKELEKQPQSGISWLPYELEAGEAKKRFLESWGKTRSKLQEAILGEDLLDVKWVRETAILFGAIPNPKDGFVYYLDPEGNDRCWKDDGRVVEKWIHSRGYGGQNPPDVIYYTCCEKCGERPHGPFLERPSIVEEIGKKTPRVSHSDEAYMLNVCLDLISAWRSPVSHCQWRFRDIGEGKEMDRVQREFLRRELVLLEEVFSEVQKPVNQELKEWQIHLPQRVLSRTWQDVLKEAPDLASLPGDFLLFLGRFRRGETSPEEVAGVVGGLDKLYEALGRIWHQNSRTLYGVMV